MSRRAGERWGLAGAAVLTTWLALFSWSVFVEEPWSYLDSVLLGMLLVAGVGAVARRSRMPAAVVVSAQLLTVMLFVNAVWGSAWWPSPDSVEHTAAVLRAAVDASQQYMAPVSAEVSSVAPLMVSGGLLLHLLVDALAVTLGRVPAAGLPLLVTYSLPVSIVQQPVSWVVFAMTAAGFLLMLVVHESDRIRHWGRSLDGRPADRGAGIAGTRHTLLVGTAATAIAVALPVVVPTLDLAVFAGSGPGGGAARDVRIENPMTDLQRDLVRGDDDPLLVVEAERRPTYLRTAALTQFTGDAWTPGDRELPAENAATGDFPLPEGLSSDVPRSTEEWTVRATGQFKSKWLPTPLFLNRLEAGEDWRYDSDVLDVYVRDDDLDSANDTWSLTAVQPRFDFEELASAEPAPFEIDDHYTRLPQDVPAIVDDLAEEVTAGYSSRYERAVALQDWFRREFTYSLDVAPGNGGDLLAEFLAEDGREGYCEQFASAMAVMARSLDIPARVAVGFLAPDAAGDDEWVFSVHDLHAWPELYFEGAGWVRFEPTPAFRAQDVPAYTRQPGEQVPGELPTAPTATTLPDPQAGPTTNPNLDPGAVDDGSAGTGGGPSWLWWTALGLVLLAALLLVPSAVRRARTARRWRAGDPAEAAWAELRDLAVDHGVRWPQGRSPRVTASVLEKSFAAPAGRTSLPRPATGRLENIEAARSLDRIVDAVEQSRYAGDPVLPATDELRAWVETCGEAMHGGLTRQARLRTTWWPASVVSWRHVALPRPALTRVRSHQDVVDHVG